MKRTLTIAFVLAIAIGCAKPKTEKPEVIDDKEPVPVEENKKIDPYFGIETATYIKKPDFRGNYSGIFTINYSHRPIKVDFIFQVNFDGDKFSTKYFHEATEGEKGIFELKPGRIVSFDRENINNEYYNGDVDRYIPLGGNYVTFAKGDSLILTKVRSGGTYYQYKLKKIINTN